MMGSFRTWLCLILLLVCVAVLVWNHFRSPKDESDGLDPDDLDPTDLL